MTGPQGPEVVDVAPGEMVPAGCIASCCVTAGNRVTLVGNPERPEQSVEQCGVCGRKHYRVNLNLAHALGRVTRPS